MFEMVLYLFCCLAAIAVMALLLPVRFHINASGGTEGKIEIYGRIMIFSGFIGCGLMYLRDNNYYVTGYVLSWRVIKVSIQPIVNYYSGKRKKEKEVKKEKEKPLKKKQPVLEIMKTYYHKVREYRGYAKTVFRDFREIVRIDLFLTHVELGLKNPGLTGKIVGLLYAINSILPDRYIISPSWNFSKTTLQCELHIKITVLSHQFWKKLIINLPLILSIIRKYKAQKKVIHNTLAVQEVG